MSGLARNEAIVHFSGGSDSTLCAALLAESCRKVHLLSYDRVSFIGARDYTAVNYERLCRIYGRERFVRRVVKIDALHRQICYHGYLGILRRHQLAVSALAFSKLAMHWYSSIYALAQGIGVVADGAVPYMELYPDQNATIGLEALRGYYQELGVDYRNPVYGLADRVEQMLYDKGILEVPFIRGTGRDKQVYYLEQVILALFLKYYLTAHGKAGYEKQMRQLFADRIELMKQSVLEWRARPAGSLVERCLGKDAGQ